MRPEIEVFQGNHPLTTEPNGKLAMLVYVKIMIL